jgi:hypothetical protein
MDMSHCFVPQPIQSDSEAASSSANKNADKDGSGKFQVPGY